MDDKELKKILKTYVDKGFYLTPIKPRSKETILPGGASTASNQMRQINKWISSFPGCNWGIWLSKSGHIAVDVDVKHGGMDKWNGIIFEYDEPHTPKQVTGSGGFHYVLKDGGLKFSKHFEKTPGIDIKHKGYILVHPSINAEGGAYVWEKDLKTEVADIPDWMLPFVQKETRNLPDFAPLGVTGKEYIYFERLCEQISQKEFGHDKWVDIGAAIHHQFPGPEGFHLWDIISRGINYNAALDEEAIPVKWESFKDDKEENRTIKSLIWDAVNVFNIKLSIGLQEWLRKIEHNENEGWFEEEGRMISVHKEVVISWMNESGYFMLTEGMQKGLTLSSDVSEEGQKRADLVKAENLKGLLANRAFKYYSRLSSGHLQAKYKAINEVWEQSLERREYARIVFEPNGGRPNELNLWLPMTAEPVPGDVSDFFTLCEDAISSGDKAKAKWLMQWLAHIVQFPGQKCTFGPVLIGLQGTGKGTLMEDIMGGILKHYFWKIERADGISGKFNINLGKRLLTFVDESTWRGHKAEDNFIKNRMTSKSILIEEKFGAAYPVSDFTRHAFASNNAEAVGIEKSNRRYVVFHTNDKYTRRENKELFARIAQGIREGTLLPAVFHFLKTMDLSGFDYMAFPNFDSQSENTVLKTEGIIPTFWNELLFHAPQRVFRIRNDQTECLDKRELFTAFEEYVNAKGNNYDRSISRQVFWEKSYSFLPKLKATVSKMRLGSDQLQVYSLSLVELATHYNVEMSTKHDLINPHQFFIEDGNDFEEVVNEEDF